MRKQRPPEEDQELLSRPRGAELGLCAEQLASWHSSVLTQWNRTSSHAPSLTERKEPFSHSSGFVHCEDKASGTLFGGNAPGLGREQSWRLSIYDSLWSHCSSEIPMVLWFLFLDNYVAAAVPTHKPLRIPGRKKTNGWVPVTLIHKASTKLIES